MPDSAPKPPLKALHTDFVKSWQTLGHRPPFDGVDVGVAVARSSQLPENSDGRNYTGGTPPYPHSAKKGRGCGQSPARRHDEGTRVTKFYWVNGPWNGKLALAARPRGGDWLEDDVAEWKRAGIGTVLSLLAAEEEKEFDLQREGEQTRKASLEFLSLPI